MLSRLRPILRTARELGAFVNVDMEQYAHKDLTYAIFRAVLDEPEFRDWADVGIRLPGLPPEAEGISATCSAGSSGGGRRSPCGW